MPRFTVRFPLLYDEEWLKQKYLIEKLSCKSIATIIGCHYHTVWQSLITYGIPRRRPGTYDRSAVARQSVARQSVARSAVVKSAVARNTITDEDGPRDA
jgi:hypothetical protein